MGANNKMHVSLQEKNTMDSWSAQMDVIIGMILYKVKCP